MSINISKYNSGYGKKWASYMSSEELMKQKLDPNKPAEKSIIPLPDVDENALSDVGNSAANKESEEDKQINDFINADNDDKDKKKESAEESEMKNSKPSKSGIFPMLFKIVPIGMNIFKKFPKVMSGLADTMTAIQQLIVNSVITVADFVPSSLAFISFNFALTVIHVNCGVMNLKNLHICCIPYALEFVGWLLKTAICSFVNILDTIMLKTMIGFPLYDLVKYGLDKLTEMIHYPDYIIEVCYSCKLTKNNSAYNTLLDYKNTAAGHIGKIVTKDVPPRVIQPAKKGITGIGKMTSIFNI
jgi:hypothetical protein